MARLAIRMPKMSMTMTEGEVVVLDGRVGDEVAEGDVVCEVMTDKVDMEVESTVAGTLVEIVVESGMAAVGDADRLGRGRGRRRRLRRPAERAPPTPTEPDAGSRSPTPDPVRRAGDRRRRPSRAATPSRPQLGRIVPAVPRARALAREHGIDLAAVRHRARRPGPGRRRGGERCRHAGTAAPAPTPHRSPHRTRAGTGRRRRDSRPAASTASRRDRAADPVAVARKMTPTRGGPAVHGLARHRPSTPPTPPRQGLSWTTVLLRAYAAALRDVPELLCRWEDDRAPPSGPPAVALAVATDRGLLVPVFAEPDRGRRPRARRRDPSVVAAAHTGKLDPALPRRRQRLAVQPRRLRRGPVPGAADPPQASVLRLGSISGARSRCPAGSGWP